MSGDDYFDRMICSDDSQTWWWPRYGPALQPADALERIAQYHHHQHYYGGTIADHRDLRRNPPVNIKPVWMRRSGPEPGFMEECAPITRDSFPYWRIDLS